MLSLPLLLTAVFVVGIGGGDENVCGRVVVK